MKHPFDPPAPASYWPPSPPIPTPVYTLKDMWLDPETYSNHNRLCLARHLKAALDKLAQHEGWMEVRMKRAAAARKRHTQRRDW